MISWWSVSDPWHLCTPVANVVGCERSGPYSVTKTAGRARLSLADRGLTFATNADAGLCIRFADSVAALHLFGQIRSPGITVIVERRFMARPSHVDRGCGRRHRLGSRLSERALHPVLRVLKIGKDPCTHPRPHAAQESSRCACRVPRPAVWLSSALLVPDVALDSTLRPPGSDTVVAALRPCGAGAPRVC